MLKNTFKQRLLAGEPQIGLWLSLANGYTAEICATAGFDWLLIDGEHSPNDLRTVLEQLQAIAPYHPQPVVRPVLGRQERIKQMLDLGAQTLLIPMVEDAQQARVCVAATRYPPTGVRGVGSGIARASRWSLETDYPHYADDECCLLLQVESPRAMDHIEAICAVDGVDGVFVGPSDLCAAMGHRGKPGHPEVQAVVEDGIRRIVASGKAAGILTSEEKLARRYLELGATFVAVGIDVTLLARSARALAQAYSRPTA